MKSFQTSGKKVKPPYPGVGWSDVVQERMRTRTTHVLRNRRLEPTLRTRKRILRGFTSGSDWSSNENAVPIGTGGKENCAMPPC